MLHLKIQAVDLKNKERCLEVALEYAVKIQDEEIHTLTETKAKIE